MLLIVYLLCLPVILSAKRMQTDDDDATTTALDPLTQQTAVDQKWIELIITAPTTINLLGQIMVVASKKDVSLSKYTQKYTFKYIEHPQSFRATMFQISREGSKAFLEAHNSMNKIRLYMVQVPTHVRTMIKILSSNASWRLVKRTTTTSMGHIERLSKTCVQLAKNSENAFKFVLDLIDEVITVTTVTQGGTEADQRRVDVQLNLTRTLQADLQKENEERRRHYDEMRESVKNAQREYSQALKDIPTGFKALGLELGRAIISVLKTFSIHKATGLAGALTMIGGQAQPASSGTQSYGNEQTLNYVSGFLQSMNSLISKISSSDNESVPGKELDGYKVIFRTYMNMINPLPNNPIKNQASGLIERAMNLVDARINDDNATILDNLKDISNDAKPLIAAQQLSPSNTQTISAEGGGGDLSQNELFKARIAQSRLDQAEKRLDAYHSTYMAAMEQMRTLTVKLVELDIENIDLKEVIKMLKEAFILLSHLREHWFQLVTFFSNFSARVSVSFSETVQPCLDRVRDGTADPEVSAVDRNITLQLLAGEDSMNLFRESFFLHSVSRTYFQVSSKYLLPRIGSLSKLLAAATDDERLRLLQQLGDDVKTVQNEVKQLVDKRQEEYDKIINRKRAEINKKIDQLGGDGSEEEDIQEGKNLLQKDDYTDEAD